MDIGRFLAGIAALIWDPNNGKYLLLRRAGHRDFQAGAWECVTGRVDQGESYEQALHREVYEEIGARIQVEFIIATTHFYRGEALTKNELLGVIYGCTVLNPDEVDRGEEHSEICWASAEEALTFLPNDHWLRNVIQRAELMKTLLPDELQNIYRQEGFNIG